MPVETFWDGLERRVAAGATLHDGVGDLTPPSGVSVRALRRVLDLEAHHLRRPEFAGHGAALSQQLLARAVATGEDALAGAARERIEARGLLALATRWRTRPPSPALLRVLEGHGDAVTGLALEPDGRLLSVDASGATGAWDPATGLPAGADPVTGRYGPEPARTAPPARAVAASTDGGLIAVAGADHVIRVLAAHGPEVAAFGGHSAEVTALSFTSTPAGATQLVSASEDGVVRVWEVITGAPGAVAAGHSGPVRALAVPGPGTVVSGGDDGALRIWDTGTGGLLAALEGDTPVTGIAPVGPAELLVVTADGAVHSVTVTDGVPHDTVLLEAPGAGAGTAVPVGPGRALVTRADGTVELWRTGTVPDRTLLAGHTAAVRAAAASEDGRTLATGDDHGRILVWDPAAAVAVRDRPGLPTAVGAVAVAVGLVVSAAADGGHLVARDARSGDERWRSSGEAEHLWSDTGGTRLFAASGDIAVELHAVTGVRAGSVTLPGRVLAGRGALVVLADDERIAVADARTGRVYRSVPLTIPARRAALTPGGSTVLLGSDTTLAAWHPARGTTVTVPLPGSMLAAVAVDDDGCHAVAADADGRAHLWQLGSDTVTTVRADPVQVRAAAGTAGHRAVTAGAGGSVVLWDLAGATALGRAPLDAPLGALAAVPGRIVVGDACGDTHCLDLLQGVSSPLPEGVIPEQSVRTAGDAVPAPRPATVGTTAEPGTAGGLLRG